MNTASSLPQNQELSRLDIAVISRRDDHGDELIRTLQRTRARVQHIWPMPDEVPVEFDVVFCELVDDLPKRIKGKPGILPTAIIVVVPANAMVNHKLLENCAPHSIIHMPCTPQAVVNNLSQGRNIFLYERRLRQRIEKLDENLRSMKAIEQAKAIMMQRDNISEEEAYRQLRFKAMDRRITIGSLASAIVDSQEILG